MKAVIHLENDERLFLALNQVLAAESQTIQWLTESGYLNEEKTKTEKGEVFIKSFIEEREEVVYRAILSSVDDVEAFINLRSEGIVQQHPAFLLIVRDLISQGRILKKN
jgi:hypothetical protein